jgi:hypothetical protein
MKLSGYAAAGALALLLATGGVATAGSAGFDRTSYRGGAEFGVFQVGGGWDHREGWRGHRHRHRHHDRHDHGRRHRRHGSYHYSRGYPHHHYGHLYYEPRVRYSEPYGYYGRGWRRGCD